MGDSTASSRAWACACDRAPSRESLTPARRPSVQEKDQIKRNIEGAIRPHVDNCNKALREKNEAISALVEERDALAATPAPAANASAEEARAELERRDQEVRRRRAAPRWMRKHICTHAHIHTYTRTHAHAHAHAYSHTCTQTC